MQFSISEATSIFGLITDLYKKGSTLEAQRKLLEMQGAFLELQAENHQLKVDLAELRATAEKQRQLVFRDGVYWHTQPDGSEDGPFCQKCRDVDGKDVRLQMDDGYENGAVFWKCHGCSTHYEHRRGRQRRMQY